MQTDKTVSGVFLKGVIKLNRAMPRKYQNHIFNEKSLSQVHNDAAGICIGDYTRMETWEMVALSVRKFVTTAFTSIIYTKICLKFSGNCYLRYLQHG